MADDDNPADGANATKQATLPADNPPPLDPATDRQKVGLAIILFIFTAILAGGWFWTLGDLEDRLQQEHNLTVAPITIVLRAGPPTFYYDRKASKLFHRGSIDAKLKAELIALPMTKEGGANEPEVTAYNEAISSLAYLSNASLRGILICLLLFGGLSGMLGWQLRALVNFVNVICHQNKLDVTHWWPWYAMQPFIAFILGVVVVLLVKAELIQLGDKTPSGSLWWAAMAFLAGFGASEFTDRLRLLTQTLFGKSAKP